MSNFNCDKCGLPILEDENGDYMTGCEHYPLEVVGMYNKTKKRVKYTFFKFPPIEVKCKPEGK